MAELRDTGTPLATILDAAGWSGAPTAALSVRDGPASLPTAFPIEVLAVAALGAAGLAAADIRRRRAGRMQPVTVDRRGAALAMCSADYLRVDGRARTGWDPITGYYPAADGRWVYLHGNFPHLRDGLLEMLAAENTRESVAAAVARLPAQEVEDRAGDRNLCATMLRARAEWEAHPQYEALSGLPLIEIARIGDAPPIPLPEGGERPLSGHRVLDLTRVIAGPMAGRALAEHGADVLRINGPHLPFIEPLVIDTGLGKRSCHVDLRESGGIATLDSLVAEADVFLDAYRPGTLARRGFGPWRLAALRPGIVTVSISAFSRAGPWSGKRGYDSLIQATTGLAAGDADGAPRRLPCQPLDYLTGYLAAFGAMVALARRADEGGSWHVGLSLARTAQWIWQMTDAIGYEPAPPGARPDHAALGALVHEMESAFGRLSVLAPALEMPETPPRWDSPPVLPGTDAAAWLERPATGPKP